MEQAFSIYTDTSANLPVGLLRECGISVIPYSFSVNGAAFETQENGDFNGVAFYNAMRQGALVNTTQINPFTFEETFEKELAAGRDVLFVSMSSGISGSFNSAKAAQSVLREKYPERRLCLVDTLGASLGEGLLAVMAAELRQQGKSVEEVFAVLEEKKREMCQIFTVDSLKYLRRTGRLSNASAIVGMVLHIKPLLKGNGKGKIVCFSKQRGRENAIEAIAAKYDQTVRHAETQVIGIAHADCPEDAAKLEKLLKRNHPPKAILNVCYEPVTGSHVGPGALALFFFGTDTFRDE